MQFRHPDRCPLVAGDYCIYTVWASSGRWCIYTVWASSGRWCIYTVWASSGERFVSHCVFRSDVLSTGWYLTMDFTSNVTLLDIKKGVRKILHDTEWWYDGQKWGPWLGVVMTQSDDMMTWSGVPDLVLSWHRVMIWWPEVGSLTWCCHDTEWLYDDQKWGPWLGVVMTQSDGRMTWSGVPDLVLSWHRVMIWWPEVGSLTWCCHDTEWWYDDQKWGPWLGVVMTQSDDMMTWSGVPDLVLSWHRVMVWWPEVGSLTWCCHDTEWWYDLKWGPWLGVLIIKSELVYMYKLC